MKCESPTDADGKLETEPEERAQAWDEFGQELCNSTIRGDERLAELNY